MAVMALLQALKSQQAVLQVLSALQVLSQLLLQQAVDRQVLVAVEVLQLRNLPPKPTASSELDLRQAD